jgi:hypothetical protein
LEFNRVTEIIVGEAVACGMGKANGKEYAARRDREEDDPGEE